MENLLQFYQPDYNSFTMSNTMQLSSPIIQTGPTLEENDTDYKQIICDGKKYLSCTFPGCGKIYRYKSEFVRHKVIHTSQRTISCSFPGCTKTFKREDVLKSHMRIHTGETPFKCSEPDCGQSFSSQAGLKYHGLKHKGEKEFRCSFPGCNKTFLIQSQLKQHESTLNYHQKIMNHNSPHTSEEECNASPVKVVKYEETREVKSEEKVEWGVKVKTEPEQIEKPSRNIEKEFEKMIEALVSENNAMKLKLNKIYSVRGLSSPDNVKEENKCPELPQERNFAFIKLEAQ